MSTPIPKEVSGAQPAGERLVDSKAAAEGPILDAYRRMLDTGRGMRAAEIAHERAKLDAAEASLAFNDLARDYLEILEKPVDLWEVRADGGKVRAVERKEGAK